QSCPWSTRKETRWRIGVVPRRTRRARTSRTAFGWRCIGEHLCVSAQRGKANAAEKEVRFEKSACFYGYSVSARKKSRGRRAEKIAFSLFSTNLTELRSSRMA